MGSQTVTMITEQKGSIGTVGGNNQGLSTSKPLLQQLATISTVPPSQPIHQLSSLSTATVGSTETSTPVQQSLPDPFPAAGLGSQPPDDSIIEQKIASRNITDGPDSPILQETVVTSDLSDEPVQSTKLIQQLSLSRDTVGDEPLEQISDISNIVQLNQFDFADLIFPPCNSIKNPVNTNILWRIRDFGFPFDLDTLIFKVNGLQVEGNSEFVITIIVGGLELSFDPPTDFDFNSEVDVILEIQDTADPPNRIVYNCSWFTVPDTKIPIITLVSPECNATNVDRLAPVVFDVLDVGAGVDLASITLDVEGIPVCDGLTFDGITAAVSGTGFRGTYIHPNRPFRYQSNVTVAINARDLAEIPNSSFFVCSFNVEDSSPPDFINIVPRPCATFVDTRTGLSFEVYGNVDGVDISTLDVLVDNKTRKVVVQPRILRST